MKLTTPFQCTGTSLPPRLLLAAKLLAVCLVLTGTWHSLPDPFLPFLSFLDYFAGMPVFRWVLKLGLLSAIGSLFLNRCVRLSCIAIGLVLFAGILSSKVFFENNIFFVACIFLLIGLSDSPHLIKYQLALVYFGASLNKLLDPAWRSGAFFATWSSYAIREPLYFVFAGIAPRTVPALMCWSAMTIELTLAVWLLLGKRLGTAAWLSVSFHTMMVFMTGRTFGMFYYAVLASWFAMQDNVRIADKVYTGFAGFKATVGSYSLTYFAIAVVLSLVHYRWMGMILLLMWSPLIVPVGELGYRWVARHRYRMPAFSGACTLPQQ